MKKVLRFVALSLILVLGIGALASCTKTLTGTYENLDAFKSGTMLTFEGENVTITHKLLGSDMVSFDATYEIKDGKIAFDFDEEAINNDWAEDFVTDMEEPLDFEEGEDYIKIGGNKYSRKSD